MARIALQEYCAQARQRIDERAYDDAIAICRHILQRYPTHVQTYQILGEACLAKGDSEEAEHVFKRLLGQADPENFAAYAGLGVIREEQGKYDEAIWYMERAFELIPNRDYVRHALRRLYGKRDGTEPTRIKLNKAALARLYARGGQYGQAAQELRTLLDQDLYHDRVDLKLSLAETLWRDSQREQAADMARQVLEICPNCLKAMLLLGQVQMDKGHPEEGRALLDETRRLDPENRMAQAVFDGQSPLPPRTVSIPTMAEEAGAGPAQAPQEGSPDIEAAAIEHADIARNDTALDEPVEEGMLVQPGPLAEPDASDRYTEPLAEFNQSSVAEETLPESALKAQAPVPEMPAEDVSWTAEAQREVYPEQANPDEAIGAGLEPEPSPEPSDAAAAEPLPEAEPVSEVPVAEGREELEASTIETTHQSEALAAPQAVPPDEAALAAGPDLDSPLTEVERYRLHLEQMPKDHDTRLLLARAYSAQEQMRLSLEQYQRLLRSRRDVLSKAIQDIETIVASRPDLLDAHELLADFYAKSGQLQEAVDRYRWVLRRLDEDSE